LPEHPLGSGEVRTPCGSVQTLAGQTGGNPQTRRRRAAARHPDRNGPSSPASAPASDGTDLRPAFLTAQLRLSTGEESA
jgi:hypothetical protein